VLSRFAIALGLFLAAQGCSGGAEDGPSGPHCSDVPCPQIGAGTALVTTFPPVFTELSGLAVSRRHDGVLWAHNDEGPNEIYAVDRDGTLRATVRLVGQAVTDWEDLALGPGSTSDPHIYVGDIGDNSADRGEIRVLRFAEPGVLADVSVPSASIEVFRLTYQSGPVDAEALAIDPAGPTLIIITKNTGGRARLYEYPVGPGAASVGVLSELGTVNFGSTSLGDGIVTAADIDPDREFFAARDPTTLFVWPLTSRCVVADLISRPACTAPLLDEMQGEALAADVGAFLTTSEGVNPPLHRYDVTPSP
jgi:hypothetical protein